MSEEAAAEALDTTTWWALAVQATHTNRALSRYRTTLRTKIKNTEEHSQTYSSTNNYIFYKT